MKNPRFVEGWEEGVERGFYLTDRIDDATRLTMGVRTITHNRDGLRLVPHLVVVVEIAGCGDVAVADMTPETARHYAKRLVEFADRIDAENAAKAETKVGE